MLAPLVNWRLTSGKSWIRHWSEVSILPAGRNVILMNRARIATETNEMFDRPD